MMIDGSDSLAQPMMPVDHKRMDLLAALVLKFTQTLDVSVTLRQAVETITAHLGAEGGAVFLFDDAHTHLECVTCCGATEITGVRVPKGKGIVGQSVALNQGILVRDVQNDPNFFSDVDGQTGFVTKSILCAPLSVKDQRLGAIELVNKADAEGLFSDEDLQALSLLASSAALALMNAQMAQAVLDQERVRREMELAADIQRRFLPDDCQNDDPDFPLYGINIPARGVSGDFYDYFTLPDGRIYFALGDVSGKGVNAALLMSKAASLFRCLGKTVHDPARLLTLLNDELCETASHGMFVTMVAGLYDPRGDRQGLVQLANAGHEPVLCLKPTQSLYLGADGPPLGILESQGTLMYETQSVTLEGGQLFLYTDGLTEGIDHQGKALEAQGVVSLLQTQRAASCQAQVAALVAALAPLQSGGSLRDDVTILSVDDRIRHPVSPLVSMREDREDDTEDEGQWLIDFRFPAQPTWLQTVRSCIRQVCDQRGCSGEESNDIVLAIDESCQNIIRHGYGGASQQEIHIKVRYRHDRLIFRLRDFAPMIDKAALPKRDLDDIRPGGLGLHFIHTVMDEVTLLQPREGQGNIMRLVKIVKKEKERGNHTD